MSRGWSPARALVWESLRLSWRPVLGTTVAGCAFAAIYRRALEPLGAQRDALVFAALLMTMLVVNAMTLLVTADRFGVGFEPRLFRLPLPAWALTAARFVPALIYVVLMQATVSWFMRVAFDVPWPVLAPCLLAAAVASWTLALAWAFGRAPILIAPCGLVLMLLLLAWVRPLLREDPLWSRLAAGDAWTLLGATAVAAVVAALGVTRARSAGNTPDSRFHLGRRVMEAAEDAWSGAAPDREVESLPIAPSPMRAQLWMEWREKGRLIVACTLLAVCASVAASSIPAPETARLLSGLLHFLPMMLILVLPMAGSMHGPFDVSRRLSGMDPFRAVRPVGDRELAHAILHAAARAGAAGWGAAIASVALLLFVAWVIGDAAQVEAVMRGLGGAIERIGAGRAAVGAGVATGAAWSVLGIIAAATLCGRAWVVTLGYVVPFVGVSVVIVADNTDYDLLATAAPAALVAFGVALPLVSGAAWIAAVRRRLLTWRAAALAALLWAGATTILTIQLPALGAVFGLGAPWPVSFWFVAPGLAASALLPHGLAPLALRWNRHR